LAKLTAEPEPGIGLFVLPSTSRVPIDAIVVATQVPGTVGKEPAAQALAPPIDIMAAAERQKRNRMPFISALHKLIQRPNDTIDRRVICEYRTISERANP
jgi:hypothetical protein